MHYNTQEPITLQPFFMWDEFISCSGMSAWAAKYHMRYTHQGQCRDKLSTKKFNYPYLFTLKLFQTHLLLFFPVDHKSIFFYECNLHVSHLHNNNSWLLNFNNRKAYDKNSLYCKGSSFLICVPSWKKCSTLNFLSAQNKNQQSILKCMTLSA